VALYAGHRLRATQCHSAAPRCEEAQFYVRNFEKLRIFEEIIGIFQDAHFPKMVRTFE
jgi:hypothetical protein